MAQRIDFSVESNLGNVADPVNPQDAATKNYVDTQAGGVTKIIAGTNVTISPTTGVGQVTINSTGGGGFTGGLPLDVISWTNNNAVAYVSRIDVAQVMNVSVITPAVLTGFWTVSPALGASYDGGEIILTDTSGRTVSGVYSNTGAQLTQVNYDRVSGGGFAVSTTYTGFTARLGRLASAGIYVDNNDATTSKLALQVGADTTLQFTQDGTLANRQVLGVNTTTELARIDGEIASKIGSSPSVYTSLNGTSVSTGFQPGGQVVDVAQTSYTAVRTALQTFGATPPTGSGNWTLPIYPLRLSNNANPTSTQIGTITQIADNPSNQFIAISITGNATYFANLTGSIPLYVLADIFTFQSLPLAAIDAEVDKLRLTNTVSSYLLTSNLARTNGSNITKLAIEAGSNLQWTTDPDTNNPRLDCTIQTVGTGWIISVGASFDTTPAPQPGWTANTAFPRFKNDGTVVVATGINAAAYLGNPNLTWSGDLGLDATQVAGLWQAWNNSFSDALQITYAMAEDNVGRFSLRTAPLPFGVVPTQTDAVVKALFNVGNNPDAQNNFVNGIQYDDGGGQYEYQRASGSVIQIGVDTESISVNTTAVATLRGPALPGATALNLNITGTINVGDYIQVGSTTAGTELYLVTLVVPGALGGVDVLPAIDQSYATGASVYIATLTATQTSQFIPSSTVSFRNVGRNAVQILSTGGTGGTLQQTLANGNTANSTVSNNTTFFSDNSRPLVLTTRAGFPEIRPSSIRLLATNATGSVTLLSDPALNTNGIFTLGLTAAPTLDNTPLVMNTLGNITNGTGLNLGSTGSYLQLGAGAISTVGTAASIDLNITVKGAGSVNIGGNATNTGLNIVGGNTTTLVLLPTGGAANVDFHVRGKGTGSVFFDSQRANYVAVGGVDSGGFPSIYSLGADTNVGLSINTKGTGQLYLGNTAGQTGWVITGNQTAYSEFTASGNAINISAQLTPKGTGNIQLGNTGTYAGLVIAGGSTTQLKMEAQSLAATNIDLLLQSAGTGSVVLGDTDNFDGLQIAGGTTGSLLVQAYGNSTSITMALVPKATGAVTIGNTATYSGLTIAGGNSGSTLLTSAGSATNIDLYCIPKGTGNVFLGLAGLYAGLQMSGGTATFVALEAVNSNQANVGLDLYQKGSGFVTIGRLDSGCGIRIPGGTTSYVELRADGPGANIDFVVTPKGSGNFYPLGPSLSSGVSSQPKIIVASSATSTTLGAGNAGQVLTSNGTTSAPYWGTPGTGFQNTIASIWTTTQVFTGGGTAAVAGIAQRVNNLGLTNSNGQITGWVAGATYRLELSLVSVNAGASTIQYFSATATNNINVNSITYGGGGNVYLSRAAGLGSGDGPGVTNVCYWTPAGSSSILYLWLYTSNAGTLNTQLTITRWA